ncbi:FAD synthase-like isoform X2 [Pseudomyrmex gracilis]|uniref:FAD synthase-like isoform X2 n=1 Tax=Pseudomyrmex gracilis TaxID=219809 RepID=UPI0009957627|nr:FAD synthase-like isoform X2 [Pseudomyrmex gracilis]
MINLHNCLFHICMRKCVACARISSRYYANPSKHPTARIIVIGNEILKAQVKDTNSYYMSDLLYKCGIVVKKISVISDDVEEISEEIRNACDKYTYVITSGGIGPTHDDVTFEGLAKAFNDTLHYHPKLVDIIKHHFRVKDASSVAYKMAQIPKKASLKFGINPDTGKPNAYPYIVLNNVYVFPGSPVFFEKSFKCLYKELLSTNGRFVKEEVFIQAWEEVFANALSTVVKEFPNVSFGSYPVSNCRYFKAFVTIESDNESDTKKAKQRFQELNPANIFVDFDRTPHIDSLIKYNNFLQKNSSRSSLYERSLEKFRQFYRNNEHVSICIDGSIESSVIVHLAHICRVQLHSSDKLQVVYFKDEQAPPKLEEFLNEMVNKYNLAACIVKAAPDKRISKLTFLQPHLRILLVGKVGETGENQVNRNYSGADQLRIDNPLRDWTNEDVWTFASSLYLPYEFSLNKKTIRRRD